MSLHDLNAVIEHRIPRVKPLVLDEGDGLRPASLEDALVAFAGWKTRDGRVWIPSAKGLAVVDPEAFLAAERPTPVVIQEVRVNGQLVLGDGQPASPSSTFMAGKLAIPPGGGHALEFRYWANDLTAPEANRFKYRLEPYDRDWTDAGPRRVAYYSNLDPGNYQFRVMAQDHHGTWNTIGATLPFYLTPYYYQTWWFRLSIGLAMLLAAGTINYWRAQLRELRHRAELLQERARIARELQGERDRIAKDLHDGLGSEIVQANLLLESLGGAGALPAQARDSLAQLRATNSRTMDLLRETVSALDPNEDSLAGLISLLRAQAFQYLSACGLRVRFDFPSPIPDVALAGRVRQNLFFAAKEAVNNAVKHAHAQEVWVRAAVSNGKLVLSIEDDGGGFRPGEPRDRANDPAPGGNGLRNLRHRMEQIGGVVEVDSQPGQGCSVRLSLAMEMAGLQKGRKQTKNGHRDDSRPTQRS